MEKLVALTFDDGPNTTTTMEVLDKLEKYNVVGTFFLIGDNINSESEKSVKRAVSLGCEIENHSRTHSEMNALTPEEIKSEIAYTTKKITEITGRAPEFFRPPYIIVNRTMVDNIDLPFIRGENGRDWEKEVPAKERVRLVLEAVKDGDIILLHDFEDNDATVEALDTIIPKLLEDGYEFVNVSELFRRKGITPTIHSGILYSSVFQTDEYDYDEKL